MKTKWLLFVVLVLVTISTVCQTINFDTTQTVFSSVIQTSDEIVEIPNNIERLDKRKGVSTYHYLINGANLYIQEEGAGIPLLLIHGGPGGTSHVFHPYFSNASKYSKIIYYDQRGCGLSQFTGDSTYTILQSIEDIESLRKELSIEKWFVLGHSFGGILAQYYTFTYPENVLGVILVNSEISFQQNYLISGNQYLNISNLEKNLMYKNWKLIDEGKVSLATGLFNAELNGAWKRQSFYKPTQTYAAQTSLYEWHHDKHFNSLMSGAIDYIDFSNCFKTCPIPFYIIEGKWDNTWGRNKTELILKEFPLSKLFVIDSSAHSPFQSNSLAFFTILESIFKEEKPILNRDIKIWKNHAQKEFDKNIEILENDDAFLGLVDNYNFKLALYFFDSLKLEKPNNKVITPLPLINSGKWLLKSNSRSNLAVDFFVLCLKEYPEANICYYYIAKSYQATENNKQAELYMRMYISETSQGIDTKQNFEYRLKVLMKNEL
ncbi:MULTISPECIES: alpha/beta fold hydrolase [unclassified Lentimicrobium]|uniref:alpha/beta fold hydrolase n=1 Tax=unclassified Lentimicrobium TaxID=2677434 RepID=UPI001555CBED|nr:MULTISPECIES: alpha/beta fold hydrolase [unclassified Lentimicrobium]NPD47992.1 alpha/beta fold hydrolase [Lentimicrobium sp. S6]NPD86037.1 alpha/beta fold hydrolase [Lentimicrobium sp. L6]